MVFIKLIIQFALLMALFSCNFYNIAVRHTTKKLESVNMVNNTMTLSNCTVDYWDSESDKPAMVLVHGFGASAEFQWYKQVSLLAKDYRVVMPNLLHFGKTKADTNMNSVADQILMLRELLDSLNVQQISIMGVSYGGLVAAEYARVNTASIDRLILVDALLKFVDDNDAVRVTKDLNVASVQDLLVPEKPVGLKPLYFVSSGKKQILPRFLLKDFHDSMYVETRAGKIGLWNSLYNNSEKYRNLEYDFEFPVHLIWGEKDILIPVEKAYLLKDYFGDNCTIDVIKDGSHMPAVAQTKDFNKILIKYI